MSARLRLMCVIALLGGAAAPGIAQLPVVDVAQHPAARFTGTWNKLPGSLRYAQDPPFTPAARARFDALRPQDDPGARCTESGTARIMISPYPFQLVAFADHLLLVSEFNHVVRRIRLDTREHAADPDPSFYGDTLVRWDGDTMVVDSIGFNGRNYLDPAGDPASSQLHLVERWRLLDADTLQIEFTIDDPANYLRPWTSTQRYTRKATWRLDEFSCTENNRNNPDDPSNPRHLTSTDAPAAYEQRPAAAPAISR